MAFTVEDGTGLPNANSYAALADADAYFSDRGISAWVGEDALKQGALIRGTFFIDTTFRMRFPGFRTKYRAQALEWPRSGAYYYSPQNQPLPPDIAYALGFYNYEYQPIAADIVPPEVKNATYEAAIRELNSPGALMPDLDPNGAIRMQRAGDSQIEYVGGVTLQRTYPSIFAAISGLLSVNTGFAGRAARG